MATTLAVVTQAQSTKPDGLKQVCVRIGWGACEAHLTGKAPMEACCRILAILRTEECQCWALETIANNIDGVDKEYALNLPKKCGTLEEGCPMIKMPYM